MDEQYTRDIAMAEVQAGSIEVGVPEDIEPGEFDLSDVDWDDNESVISFATFQSITSSVLQHDYENGRRYHHYRFGRYPIPNDDAEQGREALKHAMTQEMTDGRLFFSPIAKNPSRILDLGTGTGQWAIEMGDKYPCAEVIGTDLSPIQSVWLPPNVKFVVDDIEDEWVLGENFDLIHIRHVLPVIRDVERVIATAHENLVPGGWLEIQEFGGDILCDDGTVTETSALKRFMDVTTESVKAYGWSFRVANHLQPPLNKIGFANLDCQVFKTPIGTWPKDRTLRLVGKYMQIVMVDLIDAMSAKALDSLGLKPEALQELLRDAREELFDSTRHAYINYYFISAQKVAS